MWIFILYFNFSVGLKVFIMTFWTESSPGNYNTKILPQSMVPRAAASTTSSDLLEKQILSPRPTKSESVRWGPANRLTRTPRERNHGWRPWQHITEKYATKSGSKLQWCPTLGHQEMIWVINLGSLTLLFPELFHESKLNLTISQVFAPTHFLHGVFNVHHTWPHYCLSVLQFLMYS